MAGWRWSASASPMATASTTAAAGRVIRSVDMPEGIVGPPPPPGWAPGRRRIRAWIVPALVVVILVALAAGSLVRIPYYAIAPGSARDTEPLVQAPADRTYPSDGELLFTTVSLRR